MKAVILAGGLGTRISEESRLKPKPLIEIGGRPILWHIMKTYSLFGINDFIVCCGYKGEMIKDYFADYRVYASDVTFCLGSGEIEVRENGIEPWNVTLVDTGDKTMTGGRLKRVSSYLHESEDFCFTYGDGVGDINIAQLISFHRATGRLATVTAVHPPNRFGKLKIEGEMVVDFKEKQQSREEYVNGGFFVLSPAVLDYLGGDETVWEAEPLEKLAKDRQLAAYKHEGFWHPVDTMGDKIFMEGLVASAKAPWIRW